MKRARLYRVSLGPMGNIGFMVCFDAAGKIIGFFVTGQLPDRTNPPAGSYLVDWEPTTTKHPAGVFMLRNVTGHTAVEMHQGDYFGDVTKGFKSDVTGCTVIASSVAWDGAQICIRNSDVSVEAFNKLMGPETFNLEIIDGGSLLSA